MPETTRTFIAIEVPDPQRDDLERLRRRLEPELAGARWVSRSQYHVTLAFLGDVPTADLDAACRALGEATGKVEPFTMLLKGLGAFPRPSRPRTLWARFEGPGLATLERLHREIGQALQRIGHRPDDHDRFSPHVTLARFKTGPGRPNAPDLTERLQQYAGWATDPFEIGEVVTFASELRAEGPVYTPLSRPRLGAG